MVFEGCEFGGRDISTLGLSEPALAAVCNETLKTMEVKLSVPCYR